LNGPAGAVADKMVAGLFDVDPENPEGKYALSQVLIDRLQKRFPDVYEKYFGLYALQRSGRDEFNANYRQALFRIA
jgi:hypothetical protein